MRKISRFYYNLKLGKNELGILIKDLIIKLKIILKFDN